MINFIVCDDIKEHTRYLKNLINKHCTVSHDIFTAENRNALYELFSNCNNHDVYIIFMDIVLENSHENGIDIVKELHNKYPNIIIIFMSGYSDYYENVYETEHVYFLKKPFNEHHFNNALEKALKAADKIRNTSLCIKTKKSIIRLNFDDIFYFESSAHNITVAFSNGTQLLHSLKLSELEKQLDTDIFARCHQSYIVNLTKIFKIEKQTVFLENHTQIPISKRYLAHINNLFTLYLGDILC